MAIESVSITEGSGKDIAVDTISDVEYQVVKIALGADGAMDTLVDSGAQTPANSVPVVLATGTTLALKTSGAVTESANGAGVSCGAYRRFAILLDITALATEVGDTLDVYVDVSPDSGTTWLNAVHFDQVVGNGSAEKQWAVLDASAAGTSVVDVTADAAEEAVRPYLFGNQIRYRCIIVDDGDDNASFTFAVTAYAQ